MSYENPQAVIDTESAKYYANAISSIGKSVAKGISTRYAKAQAQRKANIKDQTDRMNDSSAYLKEVNKAIKALFAGRSPSIIAAETILNIVNR